MKNDEGWWFEAVDGFADGQMDKQMDGRTDEQKFVIVESLSWLKRNKWASSRSSKIYEY